MCTLRTRLPFLFLLLSAITAFAQPTIQFTQSTVTVNENDGTVDLTLEAIGTITSSVTVIVETQASIGNNPATAGLDYVGIDSQAVNFAIGGPTTQTVTVSILTDQITEPDEEFIVAIDGIDGGAVGQNQNVLVTIQDGGTQSPARLFFRSPTYDVEEDEGSVTVQLERADNFDGNVDVVLATKQLSTGNFATAGADFNGTRQPLTFGSKNNIVNLDVTIIQDSNPEPMESFEVFVESINGNAVLGNPTIAIVNIIDDDSTNPGEIAFTSAFYDGLEDSGGITVFLERIGGADGPGSVQISTAAPVPRGDATAGVDYQVIDAQTVSWADQDMTTKGITIPIIADTDIEGDENFSVFIDSPVNVGLASQNTAQVGIIDDDTFNPGSFSFTASFVSFNESESVASVTVQRLNGSDGDVAVGITTSSPTQGGATPDLDFEDLTRTLGFSDGDSSQQTIAINFNDDDLIEGDETFSIQLVNPTNGATLGSPATVTVEIVDNDFANGEFQFDEVAIDVDENMGPATVSVSRVNGSTGSASVTVATEDQLTRISVGGDYTPTFEVLNFADGEVGPKFVDIPIIDDTEFEGDETFSALLIDPVGASIGLDSTVDITIIDDEMAAPGTLVFSQSVYSVDEDEGVVQVQVDRIDGSDGVVTVEYDTEPLSAGTKRGSITFAGEATPGDDYTPTFGILTFQDGDNDSQIIEIPIIDDSIEENLEAFLIELFNPTGGASLGKSNSAQIEINDNDEAGVLEFTSTNIQIDENQSFVDVLVQRLNGTDGEVTVDVITDGMSSSATEDEDYTAINTTLTFSDGDAGPKSVSIPLIDDLAVEGDEFFGVSLSNPTGGAELGTNTFTTVDIIDDDLIEPDELNFQLTTYQVEEGMTVDLVLERTGAAVNAIDLLVFSENPFFNEKGERGFAAATPGVDYEILAESISFGAGETGTRTITFTTIDDTEQESLEGVFVSVTDDLLLRGTTGAIGNTYATTAVIIEDDDTPTGGELTFSTSLYTVDEDADIVQVQVDRINGSDGEVSVEFNTAPLFGGKERGINFDPATPGDDYTSTSTTLTFQDGDTDSQFVQIPIIDDLEEENTEGFRIELSDPTGDAALGLFPTSFVAIQDNDEVNAGQFEFVDRVITVDESQDAVVQVRRINGSDNEASVTVEFSGLSAQADADFDNTDQVITFAPGATGPINVTIPIIDDDIAENSEVFSASLDNPTGGATVNIGETAAITILDNDGEPDRFRLETNNQSVSEGDGVFNAIILREGDDLREATVRLRTNAISADDGGDFNGVNTSVRFFAGETIKTVPITLVNDDVIEDDEVFRISISSPSVGEIGSPFLSTITITDDDAPAGVINIEEEIVRTGESGGSVTVTVSRTGGTRGEATAQLNTIAGTAQPGQDYTSLTQTITFAAGDATSQVITIAILDDNLPEDDETFTVRLTREDNTTDEATVGIFDNDIPVVRWTSEGQSVTEDDTGLKAFQISVTAALNAAIGVPVTVPYQIGGTATAGTDHDLNPGTLTFQPGQTTVDLTFNIIGDLIEESDEIIVIGFPPTDGIIIGDPRLHVVTIVDNDAGRAPDTVITSPESGQTFEVGESVTFRAESPDSTSENLVFNWEARTSTGALIFQRQGQEFDFTFDRPAIFNMACYAADGDNLDQTPASVQVVIVEPDPPIANIIEPVERSLTVELGQSVDFAAQKQPEDAMGEWFLLSNPTQRFESLTFRRNFDRLGVFVVVFEVTRGDLTDRDFRTIEVIDPDDRPTTIEILSPTDGAEFAVGETVELNSQFSMDSKRNKRALSFAWLVDNQQLGGQNTTYVFSEPGRYRVRLLALDSETDDVFEDTVNIFVRDDSPPVVDMTPTEDRTIEPGTSIFFKTRIIDSKGYEADDISILWDFGDGRQSRLAVPGDISFDTPGVFNVSLIAKVRATGVQSDAVVRQIIVNAATSGQFEPNDDFSQAAPIGSGTYGGQTLEDESPVDIYRIEIDEPGRRILVNLSLSAGAVVEIYDAEQNLILTEQVDNQGNVQLQGLDPGVYFIRMVAQDSTKLKKNTLSYSISIEVLDPALFFPEVRFDSSYRSQLGIINPTGDEASAEAIGFDAQGNIVETVQFELQGKGRTHINVDELFTENVDRIAWVQVDATRDLVGYTRTESRDLTELYGVNAGKRLRSELFVPHIAEDTDFWFTRASVINGSNKTTASRIETPAVGADLKVEGAFSQDAFDFETRFEGPLPEGSAWATLEEQNQQAALVGAEVFGTRSGDRFTAGLSLADVRQDNPNFTYVGNNLYFTHIARDTDNFYTGVALVNISEVTQTVEVIGYGVGGGELGRRSITLTSGQKVVQLAEEFLTGIGTLSDVDWFLVQADQQIVGYELFGTRNGLQIAGLEASQALSRELCYPFVDVSQDVVHGITVINPNPDSQNITLTLYDDSGVVVGTTTRELGSNEKLIDLLESLFPEMSNTPGLVPGWLEVTAEQFPLAGFELFTNTKTNEQMGALIAQ